MRDLAEASREDSVSSEDLPPFTRNAPVTFRAMFGGYSRLVLMGIGDAVIVLVGQVVGAYVGGTLGEVPALPGAKPWCEDPVVTVVAVVSNLVFLIVYRGYRDLHRSYAELGRDMFTAALWSVSFATLVHLHRTGRPPEAATWLLAGVTTACLLVLWRVPFARWARRVWCERPLTLVSTHSDNWQWRLPSYVAVHSVMTPKDFLQAPPATQRVMITPDVRVEERELIVTDRVPSRGVNSLPVGLGDVRNPSPPPPGCPFP